MSLILFIQSPLVLASPTTVHSAALSEPIRCCISFRYHSESTLDYQRSNDLYQAHPGIFRSKASRPKAAYIRALNLSRNPIYIRDKDVPEKPHKQVVAKAREEISLRGTNFSCTPMEPPP